jgi:chromosome segregation ATPase
MPERSHTAPAPRKDRQSTYDLVHRTALALLAEGIKPSVQKIQEATGTTASTKTLNDALSAFWREAGRRLNRPELPAELTEPIMALWQHALDRAEQALAADRAAAATAVARAQVACEAAEERSEALDRELSQTRQALADERTAKADLEQALRAESAARTSAEVRLEQARTHVVQREQALAEAHAQGEAALAHEKARADEQQQRLIAQLEEQRALRVQAEKREQALVKQQQALAEERERLREALARQTAQLATREAALAEVSAARERLAQEVATLRQRLAEFEADQAAAAHRLDEQQVELADQQAKLADSERRAHAAAIACAQAEREAEVLARQLDALAEKLAQRPARPRDATQLGQGTRRPPTPRRR